MVLIVGWTELRWSKDHHNHPHHFIYMQCTWSLAVWEESQILIPPQVNDDCIATGVKPSHQRPPHNPIVVFENHHNDQHHDSLVIKHQHHFSSRTSNIILVGWSCSTDPCHLKSDHQKLLPSLSSSSPWSSVQSTGPGHLKSNSLFVWWLHWQSDQALCTFVSSSSPSISPPSPSSSYSVL